VQPRITVVTLGVDDLERALVFYRDGLGLPTRGIVGQECLSRDCGLPVTPPSAIEFTLGHNVGSRTAVDLVMGPRPSRPEPGQARGQHGHIRGALRLI
jgi:uncharacterized protein